ncbi:hypothetical protein EST38_g5242 [Candolleomyces aberdarensis]|uniref:Enoyl reductase (ER) domain-containing protein n=1 Tax=Candolleomyces aberdarensis TaxID=2316362 RepID=A0A4Q2DP73_9AGAR|nr:hypothetical protein EST38_g5242 [Candolleomyces aberdarensis]
MSTQKALVLPKLFDPLELITTEIHKPGNDEVLVEIRSAALNPADWKFQKEPSFLKDYPIVLGVDIAGDVVELGEGVTQFAIGDRVLFEGIYGANRHNGFQQYAIAGAQTLAKIPSGISYDEAASIPLAFTTAYVGLYNASPHGAGFDAAVNPGARGKYADTPIVIIGGSSSVGQFTIQLAKLSGFNPIITTSSLAHEQFLKSLGATHVLDRFTPLTRETIQSLIGSDKPIKIVYDAISTEETQTTGFDLLSPGGQLVVTLPAQTSIAERAATEGKAVSWTIAAKNLPFNVKLMEEFWPHATRLLESGDIKPNRVEVLPNGLNGIVDGLKRMEEDKVSGVKLIVRPQET